MASTIVTKNSSTASAVPVTGDLTQGELAVNVTDKKLYTKDSGGTVVKLVGGLGNQEANAVAITGGSVNGTTIGATTASTGAFTTLSASSTVSGTGFSTYLASPPAIGGTTAAAGSFTTLSASGNTTLSGGTANGVAYLNGSKVVTTGSALTFDGTSTFNVVSSSQYPLISVASTAANNIFGFRMDGSTGSGNGRDWRIEQGRNAVGQFNITDITAGNTVRYSIGSDGTAIWNVGAGTGSEQMRLTSTGLGIGTSSPGTKLTVANGQITVTNSGAINPSINFAGSGSGASGFQIGQNYNSQTLFVYDNAAASQRLTLDANGKLLVGLTSSGSTNAVLQTNGPANFKGYTVSTLPSGTLGDRAYVTDAVTAVFQAVPTGGGSVKTPVFYNGSNWVCG